MAEIREVMLLILTHYGHSYLMHKISNNVLIIFKRCYFEYSSLLLQNMQLLLMYYLYSCTTISLIVIHSENLEVVLLFTVCYDGCVQEKCREQNLDLYMVFVDLTKAFDTISRDGLWQILRKIGCPELFVDIIRSFHEGMVARVQDQGQTSEPFSVTNGTKQGCVMAPLLFTLVFSAMLNDAFHDNDSGALIRFRTDGNVFNLRRLN